MSEPPVKDGNFSIYLEKLESNLVSSIHPKCYLCEEAFEVNAIAIAIRSIGGNTLRLEKECFNDLMLGILMFDESISNMKVFSTQLN